MLGGRRAQGQEARRGLVRRNEGRAHARGNALAFILIGKYNDRLSPSLRSEGTYVVEERRRKREGEGGGGREGCERGLPRICYGPIAIVSPICELPLRHCSPPFGWLHHRVCLRYGERVCDVYLLAKLPMYGTGGERARSYVTIPVPLSSLLPATLPGI